MAVGMGQICVERATIDQLKQLCKNIVDDQTKEIKQLQSWLRDWYNVTQKPAIEPNLTRRDQARMAELRSLSGKEFDRLVMERFVRGHWQIVAASELCLDQVDHKELFQFCDHTVRSQSDQIRDFQYLLCKETDVCNYGPRPDENGTRPNQEPNGGLPDPTLNGKRDQPGDVSTQQLSD